MDFDVDAGNPREVEGAAHVLFPAGRAFCANRAGKHQHRTGRVTDNHFGRAAELNMLQARVAVGRKDNEADAVVSRDIRDFLKGFTKLHHYFSGDRAVTNKFLREFA